MALVDQTQQHMLPQCKCYFHRCVDFLQQQLKVLELLNKEVSLHLNNIIHIIQLIIAGKGVISKKSGSVGGEVRQVVIRQTLQKYFQGILLSTFQTRLRQKQGGSVRNVLPSW